MNMIIIIAFVIFLISGFCIFWGMIGYKYSLKLLSRLKCCKKVEYSNVKPTVTVMIVAYNEEKVILDKLNNVIDNDYPKDKIKYLVTSDNSTDRTNEIVTDYINKHQDCCIKLYKSVEHKGKTNAQNEAQKLVDTEILVMTDANSMFEKDAISQLVSSFSDESIAYVCGQLKFVQNGSLTTESEITYWNGDLEQRKIESSIFTITAGNGSIYACKNCDYIDVPAIECHDSTMPYYYATHKKRAIYNENAIAYEKTSANTKDEFKRKVRMNRGIVLAILRGIHVLNFLKYGWFSYFYFGHRTTRYLLWLNHLLVFISNLVLCSSNELVWWLVLSFQIIFYLLAALGRYSNSKVLYLVYYYCITILAQWKGIINNITGVTRPTWESVKSTR